MSRATLSQINDESTQSIYSELTCCDLSKKRSKKSYLKRPIKNGEWDRNEVIKFFTCNTMFFKYQIPWKYLIKFIESRTVQQVYNKIKISQEAIKYVNINFWDEYSVSEFPKSNSKEYFDLFSQIQKKIAIFLSHNSKNIFHTKKQKLNAIPKIQMHHFSYSQDYSKIEASVNPFLMQLVKNISLEMGNEDFSSFLNLNQNDSKKENLIKIDYKSLMQFLVSKNEN